MSGSEFKVNLTSSRIAFSFGPVQSLEGRYTEMVIVFHPSWILPGKSREDNGIKGICKRGAW